MLAQSRALDLLAHEGTEALASALAHALSQTLAARTVYVALVRPSDGALYIAAIEGDGAGLTIGREVSATSAEHRGLSAIRPSYLARGAALAGDRGADALDAMLIPLGGQGVAISLAKKAVPDGLGLASVLAIAAKTALTHTRARERAAAEAARERAIARAQRAVAGESIEHALPSVFACLAEDGALALDAAMVLAADERGYAVVAVHGATGRALPLAGARIPIDDERTAILHAAMSRTGELRRLDPLAAELLLPGAAAVTLVPLVAQDAAIGLLAVGGSPRTLEATSSELVLSALAVPFAMSLEHQRLLRRLRTATREWQVAFDAMDAMVVIVDEHGKVTRGNLGLAKRLGAPPASLAGRDAASLFPGQLLPLTSDLRRATLVGPSGEILRATGAPFPGGGTVVVLHDARGPAATGSSSGMRRVSGSLAVDRGRVLIVDDEPIILRAVSRALARSHEVVTASDGAEAIELLRRDSFAFDAVMTDVQMPRASGVDVFRCIEREAPHLAPRVLFMTGGVFSSEIEGFLRGMAERVLRKPFDPEVLRKMIDEQVALSRVA